MTGQGKLNSNKSYSDSNRYNSRRQGYARGKSKGDSLRKKRKKYLLKSINRKAEVYDIITFGIGVTLRDGDRQGCRGIHLTNLYKCKIINFEVTYF